MVRCVSCKASGKRLKFGTCPSCEAGIASCPRCRIHQAFAEGDKRPLQAYPSDLSNALATGANAQTALLLSPTQAKANVGYWLEAIADDSSPTSEIARRTGFELIEFLSQIEQSKDHTLYFRANPVPVVFAAKGNDILLVLDGVTTPLPAGLKNQDEESRRRIMLRRVGKDILKRLAQTVAPKVEYIGFELSYGPGPFVVLETASFVELQTVTMIAPSSVAIAYAEGQATFDELLAAADMFASRRGEQERISASTTAAP